MAEPMSDRDWQHSANDIDNWWSDAPLTDRQLDVIKSDLNNELMPEDWRPHPQIARKLVAEVDRIRAQLAELRAERTTADNPAPYHRWLTRNLGAAYAAGWEAHADLVTGTLATLSHDKREQCSRAWTAQRLDDLTEDVQAEQQPKDGNHD